MVDRTHAEAERIITKSALFNPPENRDDQGRLDLVGLSQDELKEVFAGLGEKPFRAKQIWHWIYHRGAKSFDEMNNIAKPMREKLNEHFYVGRPKLVTSQLSQDTTEKFLFSFIDNQKAETVYIPEGEDSDRGTACLSSQVGCTLSCKFCHTGTQKLTRNMSTAEIVGQFMSLRDHYDEWPTPQNGDPRRLSNIVMMGMGEPLYNYPNVSKALDILGAADGICISKRRITLSTAGVVPMMDRCGREQGCNLAISLHAVNNELRNELVPLNRKYPIEELMAACRRYQGASNSRRITFEYIMLKDVNDSDADARQLIKLIANLPAKVNLIPFNPWPGSNFEPSSRERIIKFASIMNRAGIACPIRWPRGRDILAACGQLKSSNSEQKDT